MTSGGSGCSGMQLLYLHIVRIEITLYVCGMGNSNTGLGLALLERLKLCVARLEFREDSVSCSCS